MRTTITLDDGLAKDLRRKAAEAGLSVSGLIERTLREALSRRPAVETQKPFRLVTVKGKGVQPGVDLDRGAKLAEAEDDELIRTRR